MADNGRELSGRGSLAHIFIEEPTSRTSLGSGAASPVRSSELLCATLFVGVRMLIRDQVEEKVVLKQSL